MKTNEIVRIGNQITAEYKKDNFNETMVEYAFRNNLRIVVFDSNGDIINATDGFKNRDEKSKFDRSIENEIAQKSKFDRTIENEIAEVEKKFEETDSNMIQYIVRDRENIMSQAVYIAKVSSGSALNYLYISAPIPPIDSTITVLKSQFLIIAAVLLILAMIVAQLISRIISRPIIQITKSAEKLAEGDLSANFDSSGFTEIKQLANTLSYATDELSKLDNYRKEFIANVSHDLKTPLTIIKMYGEMIKDVSGNDPEKRTTHCNMIIKEADWLSNMVNEILELSKLESNNVTVEKIDLDLSQMVMDTVVSFNILGEMESYTFDIDIDKNIRIKGSEKYLKRAVYNLISNAINYTGEDKIVYIKLKNIDGSARFEVSDTGSGIPEDKINEIWDRYYKSNEAHKRAVVGTGLGLSIVKHALNLHDAKFGVITSKGNGTTFWFEISCLS
jgi:signal transduction histidine kinase